MNLSSSSYNFLIGIRQVIKDGNIYEGWERYYHETQLGLWSVSMRYITSTNGLTWTVVNQPAIATINYPSVIKNGATYHLWGNPDVDGSTNKFLRYRTSNSGGGNWGHWGTGGSMVDIDGSSLYLYHSRVRRLDDGTFQLFYVSGLNINLATSSNGITFTNQITGLIDLGSLLSISNTVIELGDFAVVEVGEEDWFYFTYRKADGNYAIAVSRPVPECNLHLTKRVTPTVLKAGEPLTYTLAFSHTGNGLATGIVLTDIIPSVLTDLNVSSNLAITDTGTSPGYVWQVADLAPGAVGLITITGKVDPTLNGNLSFTNTAVLTATLADRDLTNNLSAAGVFIRRPQANLKLIKQVSPVTVQPGEALTYTLTFTNTGHDMAVGVVLTDIVPAEMISRQVSSSLSLTLTTSSPGYVWQVANLPPGAMGLITITGRVSSSSSGSFTNTAIIAAMTEDTEPNNNRATAKVSLTLPTSPQARVYLPILNEAAGGSAFPIFIGSDIPVRPANPQGETFYFRLVSIPDPLPLGGRFYFSSQPGQVAEIFVDDRLVVSMAGGVQIFSYHSVLGQSNIVEVPRSVMSQMAGETVLVEYRDIYGAIISATDVWLIWVP